MAVSSWVHDYSSCFYYKNLGGGMVMGMRHRLEGVMDVSVPLAVFTISLIEETCRHVLKHKLKCEE